MIKIFYLALFISSFGIFFFPTLLYAQSTTPWSFYNNPSQSNAMDIFYNGAGAANPALRIKTNGQTSVGTLQLTYDAGLPSGGYSIRRSSAMEFRGGTGGYSFMNNANTSTLITVQDGGNVGIGTTTPYRSLDLSTNGQITFGNNGFGSTGSPGIFWYTDNTNYGIYKTAGSWTSPYQQLMLNWNTGIIIDGGSAHPKSGTILQPNGGNVGIGITSPPAKLSVLGDNGTTGFRVYNAAQNHWATMYSDSSGNAYFQTDTTHKYLSTDGGWYGPSDLRLKDNIKPLAGSALDVISQLSPSTFTWKKNGQPSVGFIAQDVLPILPLAVRFEESTGYYSLADSYFIPYIVKGVQELNQQVQDQQSQIEELKKEIQKLKAKNE